MSAIIQKTISFVKETLAHAEAGHDWFHIERVHRSALRINEIEQGNSLVVELAALLHDIADSKFHEGDEEIGPKKAAAFLSGEGLDASIIEEVRLIIAHMSFKNSLEGQSYTSKEMEIVQDADRLDAIGALGIARAFTYGGFKNRVLYDPAIEPVLYSSKEAYKKSTAPTINHFYEKLLLLKDQMNTTTGKQLAEGRHEFMRQYLAQFYAEWEGQC